MNDNKKEINSQDLSEVIGGLKKSVNERVLSVIPEEVMAKLSGVKGDVEICKILAENNIDLQKVEGIIKNSYKELGKDVLSMKEEELEKISGGFKDRDFVDDVYCDCGNNDRNEFSYQFWASQFNNTYGGFYRCKKCGQYIEIQAKNSYEIMSAEKFKKYYNVW